jgi:hypothetical protein
MKLGGTCGSPWCFVTHSALPACWRATDPRKNAFPVAADIAKSAALRGWKGEVAKAAFKWTAKQWLADSPVATAVTCLGAAAGSGFSGSSG